MARYTVAELESVKQAIVQLASGARVASVTKNGRTVQYSAVDMADLRDLERDMAASIAGASRRRSRTRMTRTSKGL